MTDIGHKTFGKTDNELMLDMQLQYYRDLAIRLSAAIRDANNDYGEVPEIKALAERCGSDLTAVEESL